MAPPGHRPENNVQRNVRLRRHPETERSARVRGPDALVGFGKRRGSARCRRPLRRKPRALPSRAHQTLVKRARGVAAPAPVRQSLQALKVGAVRVARLNRPRRTTGSGREMARKRLHATRLSNLSRPPPQRKPILRPRFRRLKPPRRQWSAAAPQPVVDDDVGAVIGRHVPKPGRTSPQATPPPATDTARSAAAPGTAGSLRRGGDHPFRAADPHLNAVNPARDSAARRP